MEKVSGHEQSTFRVKIARNQIQKFNDFHPSAKWWTTTSLGGCDRLHSHHKVPTIQFPKTLTEFQKSIFLKVHKIILLDLRNKEEYKLQIKLSKNTRLFSFFCSLISLFLFSVFLSYVFCCPFSVFHILFTFLLFRFPFSAIAETCAF